MMFTYVNEVLEVVINYMNQREAHQGLGYCGEIDLICRITGCDRHRLMTAARAYRRYVRTRRKYQFNQDCHILHRLAAYIERDW